MFFLSLCIIVFLIVGILQGKSFSIDLTFYEYITSTLSTEWLSVFEQVSFLASKPAIIVISLMTLFFLWLFKKDYAGMITMVVFVMGGNVLNKLIKSWTQRERPAVNGLEEGYSFPSGHVMVGFIMYGIIVYLIYRHSSHTLLKVISLITVTLFLVIIGISRIATEEHYATDVLAGYGFGGVLLVIAIKAHHYIEKERSAKHQVHTGF
nr:phosphatase PAP2 family protein [Pseudalkalibacillus hwajinpoensis]